MKGGERRHPPVHVGGGWKTTLRTAKRRVGSNANDRRIEPRHTKGPFQGKEKIKNLESKTKKRNLEYPRGQTTQKREEKGEKRIAQKGPLSLIQGGGRTTAALAGVLIWASKWAGAKSRKPCAIAGRERDHAGCESDPVPGRGAFKP